MPRKDTKKDERTSFSSDTAKVLGANIQALMATHSDLNSNPKLAAKTKLGSGTISRLRNGEVNANLDTLQRLATAFQIQPWQLLVPEMDPDNLPTLQPISEQERRLYARLADAIKELRN